MGQSEEHAQGDKASATLPAAAASTSTSTLTSTPASQRKPKPTDLRAQMAPYQTQFTARGAPAGRPPPNVTGEGERMGGNERHYRLVGVVDTFRDGRAQSRGHARAGSGAGDGPPATAGATKAGSPRRAGASPRRGSGASTSASTTAAAAGTTQTGGKYYRDRNQGVPTQTQAQQDQTSNPNQPQGQGQPGVQWHFSPAFDEGQGHGPAVLAPATIAAAVAAATAVAGVAPATGLSGVSAAPSEEVPTAPTTPARAGKAPASGNGEKKGRKGKGGEEDEPMLDASEAFLGVPVGAGLDEFGLDDGEGEEGPGMEGEGDAEGEFEQPFGAYAEDVDMDDETALSAARTLTNMSRQAETQHHQQPQGRQGRRGERRLAPAPGSVSIKRGDSRRGSAHGDEFGQPEPSGGRARTHSLGMQQMPGQVQTMSQAQLRKSVPRPKSGCYTCRIRRKKCDETVDENGNCQTCVRLRLECLGFGRKRPDWLRESKMLEMTRERIREFLAAQGLIKGQFGPARRLPGEEAPILTLIPDHLRSRSMSPSMHSTPPPGGARHDYSPAEIEVAEAMVEATDRRQTLQRAPSSIEELQQQQQGQGSQQGQGAVPMMAPAATGGRESPPPMRPLFTSSPRQIAPRPQPTSARSSHSTPSGAPSNSLTGSRTPSPTYPSTTTRPQGSPGRAQPAAQPGGQTYSRKTSSSTAGRGKGAAQAGRRASAVIEEKLAPESEDGDENQHARRAVMATADLDELTAGVVPSRRNTLTGGGAGGNVGQPTAGPGPHPVVPPAPPIFHVEGVLHHMHRKLSGRSQAFAAIPSCEFHKISLPRAEDGTRVFFIAPACQLTGKATMRQEQMKDHGDATLDDYGRMVGDVENLHLSQGLLATLRLIVDKNPLPEQEVFYLPQPTRPVTERGPLFPVKFPMATEDMPIMQREQHSLLAQGQASGSPQAQRRLFPSASATATAPVELSTPTVTPIQATPGAAGASAPQGTGRESTKRKRHSTGNEVQAAGWTVLAPEDAEKRRPVRRHETAPEALGGAVQRDEDGGSPRQRKRL